MDAKDIALVDRVEIRKLVLILQVNEAGMLNLQFKLRPNGREEIYLVNPYVSPQAMASVCSGDYFNISVNNINLHGKKLNGTISGNFAREGSKGSLYLNGSLRRFDPSPLWRSSVDVNLDGRKMTYAYDVH